MEEGKTVGGRQEPRDKNSKKLNPYMALGRNRTESSPATWVEGEYSHHPQTSLLLQIEDLRVIAKFYVDNHQRGNRTNRVS